VIRIPWRAAAVVGLALSATVTIAAQPTSAPPTSAPPTSAPPTSTVPPPPESQDEFPAFEAESIARNLRAGLEHVAVRLPWAAVLGTALALRPRRPGSPPRDPAVIETQIVLAIVGALIMLVVGQSLARAFGIAGAANLIRYRAKIEDPKDAVVMLSALAVGLAAGVGLFGIATAATGFLVITLWIIEGFENRVRTFLLTLKLGEATDKHRGEVEKILKRAGAQFELRATSDDELSFLVSAGQALKTERLTAAFSVLAPSRKADIEWKEETKAKPLPEDDEA
jgi:hypothetical protein